MLISFLKYVLWWNLIMILSAFYMSATFNTHAHGYSWSPLFEAFLLLIFSLNLRMNFFTCASVLLILTRENILSSSVSHILQFLMPIVFTVTSFLTSGSSSFGGWNSALIVHSDSGFQRKAG